MDPAINEEESRGTPELFNGENDNTGKFKRFNEGLKTPELPILAETKEGGSSLEPDDPARIDSRD